MSWLEVYQFYLPQAPEPSQQYHFFPEDFLYKTETKLIWSQHTLKLWSWPDNCLREFVSGTEPWLVSRDSRHSWTSAIFLKILNRVWGDKSKSILSQDTINRSQFTDPINNSPPWYNISGLNIIQIWHVFLGRLPYSYTMLRALEQIRNNIHQLSVIKADDMKKTENKTNLSIPGIILRKSLWQPNCSLKAVKDRSAETSQPRKARRARRKDQE